MPSSWYALVFNTVWQLLSLANQRLGISQVLKCTPLETDHNLLTNNRAYICKREFTRECAHEPRMFKQILNTCIIYYSNLPLISTTIHDDIDDNINAWQCMHLTMQCCDTAYPIVIIVALAVGVWYGPCRYVPSHPLQSC